MKKIFEWIMEQMHEYSEEMNDWNEEAYEVVEFDNIENIINEAEAKWEAEEKEKPFTVGIDVHKQVMWERDTAIEQLHELGYELGEKPREADCCEWKHARSYVNCFCKCNGIMVEHDLAIGFEFCPYCGKLIRISEVE